MDEPIEETYFKWLYSKVSKVNVPTPSLTYWSLLRDLHAIEFVWVVIGDDNRAGDGLEVRKEFLRQAYLDEDPAWMDIGCSFLEMLIGLAKRAEFDTYMTTSQWFWIFIENLGLTDFNDSEPWNARVVGDVVDRVIWRTYHRNGQGGIFPLHDTDHDQRKVELWYQFCEYLVETE